MTICDCDIILLLLKMYIYYLFVLIVPNLNVIFFENTEINSIQSTDVSNRYFVFCHTKICIRCLSQHHLISLILSEIERKEFFSKNSFLPQNSTNYHDPFNHEKEVK